MALSTMQKVIKDDERLLVYALYNLVQVFIGLSNPEGEMEANELLHQVCYNYVYLHTAWYTVCICMYMHVYIHPRVY